MAEDARERVAKGSTPIEAAPALEARGLGERCGRTGATGGPDPNVRRGEVYGSSGPDGAGKTTTLKMPLGRAGAGGGGRAARPGRLSPAGAFLATLPRARRPRSGSLTPWFWRTSSRVFLFSAGRRRRQGRPPSVRTLRTSAAPSRTFRGWTPSWATPTAARATPVLGARAADAPAPALLLSRRRGVARGRGVPRKAGESRAPRDGRWHNTGP